MSSENVLKKEHRVYSVEFWRFMFTVIVALYHLEIYYQHKLMPSGTSAVEFFFVVAGFTIAMSAARRLEAGGASGLSTRESHSLAVDYAKKKLLAIYPLLVATLVITLLIIPMFNALTAVQMPGFKSPTIWEVFLQRIKVITSSEWEWLMMVGTPPGFNNMTSVSTPIVPLWFLTHLIVIGYLYTFLVSRKYALMKFAAPLIAILGFIYFTLNSENPLDFYIKMGLFNAGSVKAIYEMAMGMSIYQLYVYLRKREWKLFGRIVMQLLELFAIYRFCALTFGAQQGIDNFRRIPYILIIVLFSFSNVTWFSKLLNRKFMGKLGKLSLTMYLIHFPVAGIYYMGIMMEKMKPTAFKLPRLFQETGGLTLRWKPIPLTWGDVILYIPFVIVVSLFINMIVFGIRGGYRVHKRRKLELAEAMKEQLRSESEQE